MSPSYRSEMKELASLEGIDRMPCGLVVRRCDSCVSVFRIVILYHFSEYVKRSPVYRKYVKVPCEALREYARLLAQGPEGGRAGEGRLRKVRWFRIVPSFRPNGMAQMRKLFQVAKHRTALRTNENLMVQQLCDVLRKYTVGSALALLTAVLFSEPLAYDELLAVLSAQTPEDAERFNVTAVLYHFLNAHINWITFHRTFVVNTCESLPEGGDGHLSVRDLACTYNVSCNVCMRPFTARTANKKDNPKHAGMVYCTDTHRVVSSCCGSKLNAYKLHSSGTILESFMGTTRFRLGADCKVHVL